MSTTTIIERPIIFSGPMVRAILADRKWQTRRIVKPQPPTMEAVKSLSGSDYGWMGCSDYGHEQDWRVVGPVWAVHKLGGPTVVRCPYGTAGDHLWVRENFSPDHLPFYPHFPLIYQADGYDPRENNEECAGSLVYSPEQKQTFRFRWRPSIHMPRAASRITLEITEIRVERLNDISEEDAIAEGIHKFAGLEIYGYDPKGTPGPMVGGTAVEAFAYLWEKINGPGSWGENPWVWAVSFKRIKPA